MTMAGTLSRTLLYALLIVFAIFFLMPIYVLVITGLKPFADVSYDTVWQLPRQLDFAGFQTAWPLVSANFFNSVRITLPAAILSSLLGSLNGYAFAKWHFPFANGLFAFLLVGILLPYQAVLIPLVLVLQKMGLYGTMPGLIFVHVVFGIPITALIFRSYYGSVPDQIMEAARIDGCGFFGVYRRVMLPIALPAFAVAGIWQFTTIWNEFIMGVVVLSNPSLAPVMVAVNNLAGSFFVQWNVQMAGAVIAASPTVIVYLLLGRLFMRGLLSGALKG